MAKFDYLKAKKTATGLIDKFGQDGTFTTPSVNGGIDPATGDPVASSVITKNGLVTPVLSYKEQEINGSNIKGGDGFVYFAGDTLPVIGDNITINAETWRVILVTNITSVNNIIVFTKVQLRK